LLKKDDKIQKKFFPYDFPVELETRAHGNVVARCPLLPGCQAQGKTAKEALEQLKNALDLYFTSATPAFFENLEQLKDVPGIYDLTEFRGYLYAATSQDAVLKSSSGAPGSWKKINITGNPSKFFNPGAKGKEGSGDYTTQIYCLCPYAPPGREASLYAGTNLNGAVYVTNDGETWRDAFSTGEDRIHALCEFKGRLYAGTSSQGKVYAYDGTQWNTVGSLSEVAVTCLGVFNDRLYAGTYPSGLLFATQDGLNWEEVSATGQNFIQCFKEFNGAFYSGTSSPKGVKVFRTRNGVDWDCAYESSRELNLYCLEVFENALYAGTGNSGRILKTLEGAEWTTAYVGDQEGVRAFTVFGDYLYAGTENNGAILRSTFDMARMPELFDLKVERLTSSSALITWNTDISATSEVHYGLKGEGPELTKVVMDKGLELRHRVHLTDLESETQYEFRVVSAYRTSSLTASQVSSFQTPAVPPPAIISPSHPHPGKWEKSSDIEILLNPPVPLSGYIYILNHYPETIPALPEATRMDDNRVAISGAAQGTWYFHVVGVDEAGNIGSQASHYKILLDTEAAPPLRLTSSSHPDPEKWVANPTPVLSWEPPKDLSGVKGYYLKADHEPVTVPGPGTGEFTQETRLTLGPLEDGLWYVHLTTLDEAGNVGREAAHYPIRIDTKALAPALSSPSHPQPEEWYSNKKVEVAITAPHDLAGIEGYYYTIDHEPMTLPDPDSAPFTDKPKAIFEDVEDGQWFVHIRTKDRADNLSPQAGHMKVCIDTLVSPPKVSSPSHPVETLAGSGQSGKWYRNRRVVLNWEDPFEHSGIEGYYYNIDRKADTVPNDEKSLFTRERSVSFELTDDGLWYFHITTKDKAGNVDWKAVHYPLRVDTEAAKPYLSSPSHPDPEQWYSNPKAVFKLSAPEDLSGITGFYYNFSEDPKALPDPKISSFTSQNEITLDVPRDGVHILSVVCQDAAGNISDAALFKVRLVTSVEAPPVASPSHPNPQQWYASRRVELTWKDPVDLSGIDGYYYLLNAEEHWKPEVKDMAWTTGRGTILTLPEDGTWYFHLLAKDKAGNIGACADFQIRADSKAVAPEVKSPTHPPRQWVKVSTPKFMWDAPAESAGVEGYYVSLDSKPHSIPGPGNGKWITDTSLTAPALKDGIWYFHITTKDLVGNLSKEASHYPVMIDTAPPKSQMKPLAGIVDKTQVYVEWSASDPHAEIASYDVQVKADNGPWSDWLSNTQATSGAYPAMDGKRYAFRVRARDAAGNVESYPEGEMAFTIVDISAPPAVTQAKATPKTGGDIELKWNPVEDRISGTDYYRVYRWVEGEPKAKISTDGEVKKTVFLDKGTRLKENTVYYYCVQAVDKMGNEQHEGNNTAAALSDHGVGTPVITSPTHSSDDWSSRNSAVFTWDAPADSTGIAGYYYLLDQSPNTRPTPENGTFVDNRRVELSGLNSGIWYFHLTAKDRAENLSEPAAHYRLRIDVSKPSAPQVTSPSHPDSQRWYASSKPEFHMTPAAKLSGVEAFYYVFDRNPGTIPVPNEAFRTNDESVALKAPEPGTWYFHAAVKDRAGNFSETTHFTVLIAGGEMPPPVVASPSHPIETESENNHDPVFTWEDRHDGSFQPAGYVYKLSPNEKETLTADDAFTAEKSVQLKDVGEGVWYFHIAAVGKRGNPGSLSSRRRVAVQRLGKVYGSFLRKDGVTPQSGTKVEMIKGEKAVATALTDPKGRFNFSSLPEGRYEIRLYSDQFPVLRLKDIPVTVEEGLAGVTFVEDMGLFPTPPVPGPLRFYYFLKEDCNVTLEVFDSTGALAGKVEERREGGGYAVTIWDAAGKPEGEYLYKLSAKSITKNSMSRFSVKKFRIMKSTKELAAQPS
jgi:predicted RNase H-like HicB family nuclease